MYDMISIRISNVNDHGKVMTSFRPTDLGTVFSSKSLYKEPIHAFNTKHVLYVNTPVLMVHMYIQICNIFGYLKVLSSEMDPAEIRLIR
jgi:hypothetical protein